MAYVVSAYWRAKEGKTDRLVAVIAELTSLSRAEPGTLLYQAHCAPRDCRLFLLYEQYVDEAAFEAHKQSEHFKRLVEQEAIPHLLEDDSHEFFTTMADDDGTSPDAVKLLYAEVCDSHAGIAEFRAKLLALLPLASGAGVFLLVDKAGASGGPLLTAIGIFGFVVTLGLFLYELRGIEDCVLLRDRAAFIERVWFKVPTAGGHYSGRRPGRLGGMVSEIGAGWIIYSAVMASWLYVAGRGADLDERLFGGWPWVLAGFALLLVGLGLRFWNPRRGT